METPFSCGLVWLRRDIHTSVLGKLLKKLRFYTDVLMRE